MNLVLLQILSDRRAVENAVKAATTDLEAAKIRLNKFQTLEPALYELYPNLKQKVAPAPTTTATTTHAPVRKVVRNISGPKAVATTPTGPVSICGALLLASQVLKKTSTRDEIVNEALAIYSKRNGIACQRGSVETTLYTRRKQVSHGWKPSSVAGCYTPI